ncbi:MAG: TIGR03546 family protein [Mariniblastus sp.]
MTFISEIWQAFRSTVKGFDSSHQLAIGIVFGMAIGLIPKDSLLPYAIALIALLTNANLLCILFSAFLFSQISPVLDPISHLLGTWILTTEPLKSFWISLYEFPVLPWTRIENTVVMGTFVLGLLLALPAHTFCFHFFEKFGSRISELVLNNRVSRWIVGSPQTPHLQKS